MKQFKSKKTGNTQIISDEDYIAVIKRGTIPMTRFNVTEVKSMKPIIPSLKETPREIKRIPNKPKI